MTAVAEQLRHLGHTALYRLFNDAGRLLYVGIGSVPESRWRDHAAAKEWWPEVTRKTVEWFPSVAAATAAEAAAIDIEDPLYNVRPGYKSAPPEPQDGLPRVPVRVVRDAMGRLLDAAHYAGEITIVSRQGEEWAAIVPLELIAAHRDAPPVEQQERAQ